MISNRSFDDIILTNESIIVKRNSHIDTFRLNTDISVFVMWLPASGKLININSVNNTLTLEHEIDFRKVSDVINISDVTNIK